MRSWRDSFILRCGFAAKRAGRPDIAVAEAIGTAWAIAEKHLLPMGHRPGANDNVPA